ncbi:PPE domain-containing protein, partial [Mycobacterium tuberculosis]|uniref:PPE domain-containing protein n=1 Tax=Mycobacterium tuberculosis TaxID=1773 RepID=UPI002029CD8D
MNFSVLPPEINSGRMFFGAGSGPMLAAAAWDGLAAELGLAAESFGLVTSGLAGGSGQAWQGAAAAMVVAAAPYAGWLAAAAARAGGAAVQAKAVAEPPRHVRRLQFLERMGSCQVVHRGGTRRSC